MTDTTPNAVEQTETISGLVARLRGCHISAVRARVDLLGYTPITQVQTDVKTAANMLEYLSAQLEAALEAVARARGAVLGSVLRELTALDGCMCGMCETKRECLRMLGPVLEALRTQALTCDTKSTENVTQTDLCAGNVPQAASVEAVTVQEAARLLLDQPYSVMSVAFDAMEKLQGEGEDRIMAAALRAIAGGRDE